MIWQSPWALLGLLALAVPVVIHLLGRRNARVQPFPTLRFLTPSQLSLTRRTRVTDWLLLIVRLGIVAAAVAALAQPLLLVAQRRRELDRALARVIIVDTSASMNRAASSAPHARDVARAEAQRLATQAATSTIVESAAPAQTLAGAVGWLQRQSGRREITILSDFQLGTLEQADLQVLPDEVGLRLQRIAVTVDTGTIESVVEHSGHQTRARVTLAPAHTDVEWTATRSENGHRSQVLVLAGQGERAAAQAAERAAQDIGAPASSTDNQRVAIVHHQFEGRADLLRRAQPLNQPWMADMVASIRSDSTLVAAAATADARVDSVITDPFITLARASNGVPVAVAARGSVQGSDRLLLFPLVDAASLTSAALTAAAARALSAAPTAYELEPGTLADATLQAWARAPGSYARAAGPNGASDGRWVWLFVLVLLALETSMRRAPSKPRPAEDADARVV